MPENLHQQMRNSLVKTPTDQTAGSEGEEMRLHDGLALSYIIYSVHLL